MNRTFKLISKQLWKGYFYKYKDPCSGAENIAQQLKFNHRKRKQWFLNVTDSELFPEQLEWNLRGCETLELYIEFISSRNPDISSQPFLHLKSVHRFAKECEDIKTI